MFGGMVGWFTKNGLIKRLAALWTNMVYPDTLKYGQWDQGDGDYIVFTAIYRNKLTHFSSIEKSKVGYIGFYFANESLHPTFVLVDKNIDRLKKSIENLANYYRPRK